MATEPGSKRRSDLPEKVLAFLEEHGPATPYTIGKGIGRSPGAVAVAGKYLSAEDRVTLSEKPVTLRLIGDERPTPARVPKLEEAGSTSAAAKSQSKGKGTDRIATLNAKKAAAKAARDAGHPIPDEQLKSMTAEQADKVAEARRTHKAPAAKAS